MLKRRREALRLAGVEIKTHRHSTNPYLENWVPPTTLRHKRLDLSQQPAFTAAGKPLDGVLLVPYERDAERFSKTFHAYIEELHELSRTARAVLDFIMYQALAGNAVVYAPAEEAIPFCGFKQAKSFYDAITELIIYDLIARTERVGFYYINPAKFFNGSRKSIRNTFTKPKK